MCLYVAFWHTQEKGLCACMSPFGTLKKRVCVLVCHFWVRACVLAYHFLVRDFLLATQMASRVWDAGCGAWGLGCRVWGLGFGFRVLV